MHCPQKDVCTYGELHRLRRGKFRRPGLQNCFLRLCKQISYIWSYVSWHLHDILWMTVHLPKLFAHIFGYRWNEKCTRARNLTSKVLFVSVSSLYAEVRMLICSLLCALVHNSFNNFTFKLLKLFLSILLVHIIQTLWCNLTLFPGI